jgi:hypothetical protein
VEAVILGESDRAADGDSLVAPAVRVRTHPGLLSVGTGET